MKHLFIILTILFVSNPLAAQFSAHLNYSEATKVGIGIGYDFNKKIWSQLTLSRGLHGDTETASSPYSIYNISANLSVNYNIVAKDYYDIYCGIGALGKIESFPEGWLIIPFGIKVRPLKTFEKLSFMIELQPVVTDDYFLFGKLGIGYYF
jgi:hypothetical protein